MPNVFFYLFIYLFIFCLPWIVLFVNVCWHCKHYMECGRMCVCVWWGWGCVGVGYVYEREMRNQIQAFWGEMLACTGIFKQFIKTMLPRGCLYVLSTSFLSCSFDLALLLYFNPTINVFVSIIVTLIALRLFLLSRRNQPG